jgi:phosphatidate cytidylyltransferase
VARVLVAIPAIVVAVLAIAAGGPWFALAAVALGIVALHELYTLMGSVRPIKLAGFLTLIALAATALYGRPGQLVLVLAASFPLTFLLALARPRREDVSWAIAATMFGVLWIGLAVTHAVLLRELPHGGALLIDVLVGTFVGDTCAYAAGRAWGTRPLAPLISPNKTLEGLLAGLVGGTFAFWAFAFAYQHEWFPGTDALLIGLMVALAAPVGDLFESLIKRDLEAKDSGRFFGPHGGVLDRLDAVFFTVVVGYYASVTLL